MQNPFDEIISQKDQDIEVLKAEIQQMMSLSSTNPLGYLVSLKRDGRDYIYKFCSSEEEANIICYQWVKDGQDLLRLGFTITTRSVYPYWNQEYYKKEIKELQERIDAQQIILRKQGEKIKILESTYRNYRAALKDISKETDPNGIRTLQLAIEVLLEELP